MVEQVGVARPVTRAGLLAGRLTLYLLILLLLVTVDFLLVRSALGRLGLGLAGDESGVPVALTDADLERLEQYYGLDRPRQEQFRQHLVRLARGDLGFSLSFRAPVAAVLGTYLRRTLTVLVLGLALAVALALTLGPVAGAWAGSPRGAVLTGALVAVYATPPFLLALALLYGLAVSTGLFPAAGATSPTAGSGWAALWDQIHHAVLPAAAIGLWEGAGMAYLVRGAVRTALGEEYMLTARSKGLAERRLLWVHALRGALPVLASRLALAVGHGVAGTVFVERAFSYPGMGSLVLRGIQNHDYPLIEAVFLLFGVVLVLANIMAELVAAWLGAAPDTV